MASPGVEEGGREAATAKQEVAGALRARATPRLCLLAEEDDRGGSGDGLGRAGPGKWAPGNFLLSFFYFYFSSVFYYSVNLGLY